jgi:putative effector of murein hydrolase
LLLLDWLSLRFPKAAPAQDVEAAAAGTGASTLKEVKGDHEGRFVRPLMAFIGPPSDFLLRNMSLLFTPAFISIPAREVLPGREVGIIAAFFMVTQVAGFVLPTLVCKAMDAVIRRYQARRNNAIANADTEKADPADDPKAGASKEPSLGAIASGMKTVTRLSIAPISISMSHKPTKETLASQARSEHVEHVQREQARQQGIITIDSECVNMQSLRRLHERHQHRPHSQRSRSRTRPVIHTRSISVLPTTRRPITPPSRPLTAEADGAPVSTSGEAQTPAAQSIFSPNFSLARRPTWHGESPAQDRVPVLPSSIAPDEIEVMPVLESTQDEAAPPGSRQQTQDVIEVVRSMVMPESKPASPILAARKASAVTFVNEAATEGGNIEKDKIAGDKDEEKPVSLRERRRSRRASAISNPADGEPDAIDRLADRIIKYFSPTVYLVAFFVGLPLFFASDHSLVLFLAVNVLTFWVAITLVPAKIRRFLHPILTTSAMTLLILWALGEIKGLSLKQTLLSHYNVDAKYDKLFAPAGYSGPVPGAADILSSLLDAGILALCVVLYRYRRDLAECGVRLVIGLLPSVIFTLFLCPALASLITLDQPRSLAFAGRFLSTPLAIELVETLEGDVNICVILVVVTGIIAALLKEPFFRLMGVDMDDHLTVGLAMGSTSGAIGASSLIARPRVMAVASLSFILFGALCLLLVAIPPVTTQMQLLALVG